MALRHPPPAIINQVLWFQSHIRLYLCHQSINVCFKQWVSLHCSADICKSATRMIVRRAYVPPYAVRSAPTMQANKHKSLSYQHETNSMLPPPLLFDVLGITPVPCAVPSYSSPSHVVPLIASRVSLPSIPSRVPMLSLLPHDKQLLLSSPSMMLLPDTTPSTRCYIGCDYD